MVESLSFVPESGAGGSLEPQRQPQLSVIIPTLNEADNLAQTLEAIYHAGPGLTGIEVIVVDGGSQDATASIAQTYGTQHDVKWLQVRGGRACQQNAGAALASGEILLFLHGDTRLAPGYGSLIPFVLSQPGVVAGAFELAIAGSAQALRRVERGVSWRSHRLQLPYGDQGLFLCKSMFEQVGGFPAQPIMEDFELVRRLRRWGRVAIAPTTVQTSARRWEHLGVARTTVINQLMILGYFLGIPPQTLAAWYRSQKSSRSSVQTRHPAPQS